MKLAHFSAVFAFLLIGATSYAQDAQLTSTAGSWRIDIGASLLFDNDDYWGAKLGVGHYFSEHFGLGAFAGRQQRRESSGWLTFAGADGYFRPFFGQVGPIPGMLEIVTSLGFVSAQERVYQSSSMSTEPRWATMPMLGLRLTEHFSENVGFGVGLKVWPRAIDQFKSLVDAGLVVSF